MAPDRRASATVAKLLVLATALPAPVDVVNIELNEGSCEETRASSSVPTVPLLRFCLAGWWTSRSNSQSDGTLLEKGCCGVLSDEDPSKKGKDTKPHPWHSRAYKDKGKQKATLEMH